MKTSFSVLMPCENAVISEVAPLSSVHLLEGTRRENVESFVTANEHAVSDAQRRRERHIALLDSIIEEEELDDVPPTHLSSPAVRIMYAFHNYTTNPHNLFIFISKTTGIHHPKPTHVSEMAQQTILAVIPEQEVDSSNESTTTVRELVLCVNSSILILHPSCFFFFLFFLGILDVSIMSSLDR